MPPLPLRVALAETFAPAETVTVLAVWVGTTAGPPEARASVVPSATVPPPARPETFSRAVGPSATVSVASTCTAPPLVPAARPAALTSPSIVTEPPTPWSTMVPLRPDAVVLAEILPPASIRVLTIPSTALAVSTTLPPSTRIVPVLVTSADTVFPSGPTGAWVTCLVTSIDIIPSP